jgi:hypothetical protein
MDLPLALRVWVRLLLYAAELAASLWLAYDLRFDFLVGPASAQERLVVLSWLVPLQLVLLALFLQFSPLLIELSGLRPHADIKIEFTGVRPGEKLFEELSHEKENFVPTAHRKIFCFISEPLRRTTLAGACRACESNFTRSRRTR